MSILITGATGFIGRRLCQVAAGKGFDVRRALRRDDGQGGVVVGDITSQTDWRAALEGVDAVVHLAARVHVMQEPSEDPLAEFRLVNVEGTENLARQAAQAGVKRLVFLSSIKVNGEVTRPGHPFSSLDSPDPQDPYAVSKHEAEQALRQVEKETGLEVVIIRPPLVYGPGVKANFLRLIQAVQKGVFIPLGRVNNKRSLVALDNLVDLIITCLDHPAAAGQTFLVSDGEDLSTPELIRKIARAMGKKPRLLPVPLAMLRLGGRIMGKSAEVERLVGSLQVDIEHTCETLGWQTVVSVDEAIEEIGRNLSANHLRKKKSFARE
jgi:nucleoside-diphosphate-sugar epimerase